MHVSLNSRSGKLRVWPITLRDPGGRCYAEGDRSGVKKIGGLYGMQKIQENNAVKDKHLQRFQCGWSCVSPLEGSEIKWKGPKTNIVFQNQIKQSEHFINVQKQVFLQYYINIIEFGLYKKRSPENGKKKKRKMCTYTWQCTWMPTEVLKWGVLFEVYCWAIPK